MARTKIEGVSSRMVRIVLPDEKMEQLNKIEADSIDNIGSFSIGSFISKVVAEDLDNRLKEPGGGIPS